MWITKRDIQQLLDSNFGHLHCLYRIKVLSVCVITGNNGTYPIGLYLHLRIHKRTWLTFPDARGARVMRECTFPFVNAKKIVTSNAAKEHQLDFL